MSISALTARLMDDCDGGSMQLGSLEVDPAWPYADEDLESPICHLSCGKLLTSVVRPQRQLVLAYRKYSESVQEPRHDSVIAPRQGQLPDDGWEFYDVCRCRETPTR
ncbi:uncharacterized protein LOC120424273 [Culex pipiens pallens]|nr:uncharacterized protein LOC120424273 [Culex pipiens pallens]